MKSLYIIHLLFSATFMVCQPTHQAREELNNRPIIGAELSRLWLSFCDDADDVSISQVFWVRGSPPPWTPCCRPATTSPPTWPPATSSGSRAPGPGPSQSSSTITRATSTITTRWLKEPDLIFQWIFPLSPVKMFAGINGLLIPGGAVSIYSSPYATAATYLVDLARLSNEVLEKKNTAKIFILREFYPGGGRVPSLGHLPRLWDARGHQHRGRALPDPLWLQWPGSGSGAAGRIFRQQIARRGERIIILVIITAISLIILKQAPGDLISDMTSSPVTANFHHWCLTRENFTKFVEDNIISTIMNVLS